MDDSVHHTYAHWWYLLNLASELLQGRLDLLTSDMLPRRGAHLLSFAIIGVGLATQETRRPILLRVVVNHAVWGVSGKDLDYLHAVKEFRQLLRTFAYTNHYIDLQDGASPGSVEAIHPEHHPQEGPVYLLVRS